MTLCHIKASDLYNKICVRDLSAQTASAEVWMVMLEVSSDMEQPCKLAERTDLSALSSGAAFEFRTCPGPCLSYITHTLGLLSLTLVLRVDFPDRSRTWFIAMDFSGHLDSGLSTAAMPSLCHSPHWGAVGLVLLGEATALLAKVARPHPLLLPVGLLLSTCCSKHQEKNRKRQKKKKENILKVKYFKVKSWTICTEDNRDLQ